MAIPNPASGYRVYWRTWLWLAGLTLLSVGVSRLKLPGGWAALLLVTLSVLKVLLIAAFFMHLRSERINLVLITVTPIILGVILFVGLLPDTISSAMRVFNLHP